MKNKSFLMLLVTAMFMSSLLAQNTFKDPRDGKNYKLVTIAGHTLMAQNLAFKAPGKGCKAYNSNESNVAKYGYLYNWETAQNVCPTGWRLPTREEYAEILEFLKINKYRYADNVIPGFESLLLGGSSGFNSVLGGTLMDLILMVKQINQVIGHLRDWREVVEQFNYLLLNYTIV
jgi:hypothetical protein